MPATPMVTAMLIKSRINTPNFFWQKQISPNRYRSYK